MQLFVLVCLLWLTIFANQWMRIDKQLSRAHRALGVRAETVYIPPTPALRIASLGHQSFLADLLYVRVAHYFVDHLIGDSQLPWLDLYLDAIWGLDAHNKSTYRWGAQVIKFGQRIDADVARRANRFCRLGLEHFPSDSWLYHEIAFNLTYHIDTDTTDELAKRRNRDLGLAYLRLAFQMPGFGYDPNYLAHQYARAGRVDESVSLALQTYASATSEQRTQLRIRLRERDKLDTVRQLAWLDRFAARDWPHLSETFTRFVGPKRSTAPPLRAERPENWVPEPSTPAKVWDKIGTQQIEAPAGMLDPVATRIAGLEYLPVDGSASMTKTGAPPPALTAP